MKSENVVFREFLERKGLRSTPEREAILAEVFAEHNHFDVDGLYLRLKRKNPRLSRASVYRMIPLLVESGLIQEVFFEDSHLHYEHIYGHEHHCHLRCLGCRSIVEFRDEQVEAAERRIGRAHDFETTGHKLEVFGYCPKCRKERE